ncbi:MAG TPA: hypothetical protein VE465_02155 [Streptosporangiaceae bacterium]|jgi:hypothetical protein|nr:hypothetical protein [Streptosporangiaceae bacterium]
MTTPDPYHDAFRKEFGEFAEMAPVLIMIGRLEAAGIQIRAIILPHDLLKGPGTVYGRPVVRADVDEPSVLV